MTPAQQERWTQILMRRGMTRPEAEAEAAKQAAEYKAERDRYMAAGTTLEYYPEYRHLYRVTH